MRRCNVTVVSSTSTANELFSHISCTDVRIDVVVVGHVVDTTQRAAVARLARSGAAIIVLTSTAAPASVMDLCADGAHAVVDRAASSTDLTEAVRAVIDGRRYLAPDLLGAMFDAPAAMPAKPRFDLTSREREVLVQLAAGRSNSEISDRLRIGTETVKTHLTSIYDKLDVRRRTHAVSLAVAHGLV